MWCVGGLSCDAHAAEVEGHVDPDSRFFATAQVETFSGHDTESRGDLWPSCWADDGHLYTANGDGWGFGKRSDDADIVVSRLWGRPEVGLTGVLMARGKGVAKVWADKYNRKPTGMIAVDGDGDGRDELYLAVQDLNARPCPDCFNDAPNASVSRSVDYGKTWETTDAPMFTDHRFTTVFFLDYGQSNQHARVLGDEGARYVYAYGLDHNWRSPVGSGRPKPEALYLARVSRDRIQQREAWAFYAGLEADGRPIWKHDLAERQAVLHDDRTVYSALLEGGRPKDGAATDVGVISQGSVVYNAPLKRYLYSSWTWYTWEFYEAPQPWGPWRLFMRKDFGALPFFGESEDPNCPGLNEGGYTTTIPSMFISPDGKTMWVQSDSWERWGYACGTPNYNFSLRRLTVEPSVPSTPKNRPDQGNNLAVTAEGTTPIEKSARHGRVGQYNDGRRTQSESSRDGDARKPIDFWGYTWPREYHLDRVVYTTGKISADGGWFGNADGGLRVQVRRDFEWVDAEGLTISPEYPHDQSVGSHEVYTLDFQNTHGDGVRIVGPPGGSARYTTIGELEVYYAD
ncbi:MAG: hypothetical protein AAF266_13260 [Planctomycetota bacterium]